MSVGTLSELPPGTVAEGENAGSGFALCNVDGTLPMLARELDRRTVADAPGCPYCVKTHPVSAAGGDTRVGLDA
ncbi:MAG TPA: hypothetical protein VFL57_01600 [Bryobacteraceae bacterium]|nr:hypothetical protein [Bryobacteraceae bacterium]